MTLEQDVAHYRERLSYIERRYYDMLELVNDVEPIIKTVVDSKNKLMRRLEDGTEVREGTKWHERDAELWLQKMRSIIR